MRVSKGRDLASRKRGVARVRNANIDFNQSRGALDFSHCDTGCVLGVAVASQKPMDSRALPVDTP